MSYKELYMIYDEPETIGKDEIVAFMVVIIAAFFFALIISLISHNQDKSNPISESRTHGLQFTNKTVYN